MNWKVVLEVVKAVAPQVLMSLGGSGRKAKAIVIAGHVQTAVTMWESGVREALARAAANDPALAAFKAQLDAIYNTVRH